MPGLLFSIPGLLLSILSSEDRLRHLSPGKEGRAAGRQSFPLLATLPLPPRTKRSRRLFLYQQVIRCEPGWLDDIVSVKRGEGLPVVLTRSKVQALLAGLVPFPNNLSDGLVSYYSQRAVGTANSSPPPYGTPFRDNHFHSKYAGSAAYSCALYNGWPANKCYPSSRIAPCANYLGTCPFLFPQIYATGNLEECLGHILCTGPTYGEIATRIQNTVWAYAGQRCGFQCAGCGLLSCTECCPIPGC